MNQHHSIHTLPPLRPSPDTPDTTTTTTTTSTSSVGGDIIERMAAETPVLVVGRRGCCMIHVVRRLLHGLGVNPAVCEVGEEDEEALKEELMTEYISDVAGSRRQDMLFPAVFIGGRLVGGLDRLMAVHISGELVPILKDAGALWL